MISSVVVTYSLKPEAMAEHLRLIEAVFSQLREEQRGDVAYQVLRLADGVTFVHVSTSDTPDASNPLPELEAFRAFGVDLGSRVASPPTPSAAEVIASYRPEAPWFLGS
jgi:hypothetical protein